MKKTLIVIIILVYGLSSTGAIVHLDYCCGKLSNISLAPVEKEKEKCGSKTIHAKSCCDSKQVHLKVKGEQETILKWIDAQKQIASSVGTVPQCYTVMGGYKPINEYSTGPPLLIFAVPLFIQHSLFRI